MSEAEDPNAASASGSYRTLDPAKIIKTARRLSARVAERFPGSGLCKVSEELVAEARTAEETCRWLATPIVWLRVGVGVCIAAMLAIAVVAMFPLRSDVAPFSSVADFFQGIDAAVNEVILIGVAIFFLTGIEKRMKSRRALKGIHVLRSLAHIIDMHQLTKDPQRLVSGGAYTPSSPVRTMSEFELVRYLDYCSEMLSIVSKIAALYVQDLRDTLTLSAVDEVESLTAGLSRKVWQKIAIIDRDAARPTANPHD